MWTLQQRRQLEADAPFDDEVAQLLEGANRDPEIIRQRVSEPRRHSNCSAKLLMTSTALLAADVLTCSLDAGSNGS